MQEIFTFDCPAGSGYCLFDVYVTVPRSKKWKRRRLKRFIKQYSNAKTEA